ncbi:Ppm1l, partial [Symbiodinium pilosum]
EGGFIRFGRVGGALSVSRSLGDHNLKGAGVSCVPDVCSFSVSEGEALLMASDGFWDALSDDDAGEALLGIVKAAMASGQAGPMILRLKHP